MARETSTNTTARGMNILLGAWLLISSFIWVHSSSQFWNTLIVGAVVALVALGAFRVASLRFVNAVAAVWLFASIWLLPTINDATSWNNGIVAAGVFALSLLGVERTGRERRPTSGRRPLSV